MCTKWWAYAKHYTAVVYVLHHHTDFGVAMKLSDSNQDDMDVVGKFNYFNISLNC
jgi:hypothetical protein